MQVVFFFFQAHLPHPDFGHTGGPVRPKSAPASKKGSASSSGISLLADDEVGSIIRKGQQPGKEAPEGFAHSASQGGIGGVAGAKLVHEQLALQWSICGGPAREAALSAGWFFLELMAKAMVEHLATTGRLGAPRRDRFSEQFHDDAASLVAKLTSDVVCRHREHPEVVERLNSALAFFLHDLISVMDRGFVFSLVRTYVRDVGSRMAPGTESLPLWHLQLSFLRIVCSHEHFVALNLPSLNPTAPIGSSFSYPGGGGGAASPSPSIRSNDSQSSFVALPGAGGGHGGLGVGVGGSGGGSGTGSQSGALPDRPSWADLSPDFRRRHFLVGLVLAVFTKSLDQS